ncbi:hypothetical protein PROFUN_09548 [Planoprotostelium fungivorum]|uniref:Right handed beta helix domain-containing protein n=1 Tax=Planoprotostelium fungivorum TaxID=1890364 RepID=A0A2P6MT17_9EUKA|nr:hypothetical protein PROFUN_09548 [Planoprotostelium fungivorum]
MVPVRQSVFRPMSVLACSQLFLKTLTGLHNGSHVYSSRDDILNVAAKLCDFSGALLYRVRRLHYRATQFFWMRTAYFNRSREDEAHDVVRRPSGIPTYIPVSTNFSGPAFLEWAFQQDRMADGYLHVGVQQGHYDVYTNGVPMFEFSDVNNITFWLDDVILTFRTRLNRFAIQVDETENVSIRGMTVHFNPPEMTQAVINGIQKVNENKWLVNATVCDGYPTVFIPGPKTWYIYSGKTLMPTEPFRSCFDLYIDPGAKFLSTDKKRFQIQTDAYQMANDNINVGDIIATRGSGVTFHGIYGSTNFSFIDVTITGSGAFAWYLESGNGGHLFQRVKVMRNPKPPVPGGVPPAYRPQLVSFTSFTNLVPEIIYSYSDGIHVVGMKKGPIIMDSLFEGMGDDGINLLNWYVETLAYVNSTTVVAQPMTYWSAGDIVRLYAANLQPLGFSQIVSIKTLSDENSTITFKDSHLDAAFISDRTNANADFVISNNTFYNHRARSILCKGSRDVITNNVMNLTSLGAIFVATGPGEGDYSTDLIIANNVLENIGASSDDSYGGSIAVNLDSDYVPLAGAFINVSIVNNTVKGSWGKPLTVFSSANSSVVGNYFVAPFRSGSALMNFQNNDGLVVRDNCAVGNTSGVQFTNPKTASGIQVCVPASTFTTNSVVTTKTEASSILSTSDASSLTMILNLCALSLLMLV